MALHNKVRAEMSTAEEKRKDNQRYIQENIDPYINRMLMELLEEKPANVMAFMAEWIYKEQNPDYIKIAIGELPFIHAKTGGAESPGRSFSVSGNNSPSMSRQQTQTEKSPRLPGTVRFDSQVEYEEDVYQKPDVTSEDEDEEAEDEVGDLDTFLAKKRGEPANAGNAGRSSVSAEVFGNFNKKETFKPRFIPKSADSRQQIKSKLKESFLFRGLDEKDFEICVDAMDIRTYKKGETVIKQGEEGHELFVVESGTLNCTKIMKGQTKPQFLLTYFSGMAFGELALMYNTPRATSVTAYELSTLYSLDRQTFTHVVKDASMKKREKYEAFLSRVELLQDLDPYERGSLCDVLTPETIEAGDCVIRQGEQGDKFYFLEEGEAIAIIEKDGVETVVYNYYTGDYFGELALLRNEPRAASIKAVFKLKVCSVDRASFKRLLGPLENLLQRNISKYEKYMKKGTMK